MLFLSFLLNLFIAALFWYAGSSYHVQWMGLILNTLMVGILFCRLGHKVVEKRLLSSQVLPSMFYLLWLYLYPRKELLYVLPQFVSFVGKVYLLLCPASKLQIDNVEQLILLQSKMEIFIILYHPWALLMTIGNNTEKILNLTFLLATMKIKFTAHYGTRKAYEQVHFGLDKLAKSLNIREGYQKIQSQLWKLTEPHIPSANKITYY